ncbi:MAG: hypothetical protein AAFU49_24570, partial [Pseudomonadota bacterium]
ERAASGNASFSGAHSHAVALHATDPEDTSPRMETVPTAHEARFKQWFGECNTVEFDRRYLVGAAASEFDTNLYAADQPADPTARVPLPGEWEAGAYGSIGLEGPVRVNMLKLDPAFIGICSCCGSWTHALRRGHEIFCPARKMQLELMRTGRAKRLCAYPDCSRPLEHTLRCCRTLHHVCKKCALRGHEEGERCSFNLAEIAWLWNRFECFANRGAYTSLRKLPSLAGWGFLFIAKRYRPEVHDYRLLVQMGYEKAMTRFKNTEKRRQRHNVKRSKISRKRRREEAFPPTPAAAEPSPPPPPQPRALAIVGWTAGPPPPPPPRARASAALGRAPSPAPQLADRHPAQSPLSLQGEASGMEVEVSYPDYSEATARVSVFERLSGADPEAACSSTNRGSVFGRLGNSAVEATSPSSGGKRVARRVSFSSDNDETMIIDRYDEMRGYGRYNEAENHRQVAMIRKGLAKEEDFE